MDILHNFSENLKKIRTFKGISQTQLAEKIEVKPQTISKYENGEIFPTSENINKIMKVLDISVNELFSDEKNIRTKAETDLMKLIEEEEEKKITIESIYENPSGLPKNEIREMVKKEWLNYILEYIKDTKRTDKELKKVRDFIFTIKINKSLEKYEDLMYFDMIGETKEYGDKAPNPYITKHIKKYVSDDGSEFVLESEEDY